MLTDLEKLFPNCLIGSNQNSVGFSDSPFTLIMSFVFFDGWICPIKFYIYGFHNFIFQKIYLTFWFALQDKQQNLHRKYIMNYVYILEN